MRRLDHRSGSGRWRTRRGDRRRRATREDCRSCQQLHREISAAASGMNFGQRIALVCLASAQFARADIASDLAQAARPLAQGVPEVAVVRLQTLLARNLSPEDWRRVAEKLTEALVASKRSADALALLADARLRDSGAAKFWRAQALASLQRWGEALVVYDAVAAESGSPFRTSAMFGAAEMLRALQRRDEALARLQMLFADATWGITAKLRAAELFV